MASGLALPFVITPDPRLAGGADPESIQANFDALKKEFPLSRKNLTLETPHEVGGGAPEPAFQGTWTNYDTTVYRGLRFWKDAMGLVHIEGAVKNGLVPGTIFILPPGYRPGGALPFSAHTNSGHGQIDVAATGNVVAQTGGNTLVGLSIHFKQES